MRPIRLVYCITTLTLGGAQTLLVHVLKHLDRSRFEPAVVCLAGGDSDIADDIRALNVPVFDLHMQPKWRLDALWRFARVVGQLRPDVIHAGLFHANLISRLIGRLMRVPVIVSWRHNIDIGGVWRERINRWTVSLDDLVVAVSEPVREAELAGVNVGRERLAAEKVIVLKNGVDVARFAEVPAKARSQIRGEFGLAVGDIVLITVGRLHPQKGLDIMLDVMAQLRSPMLNLSWLIVGEGPLRTQLEAQAAELEINDCVIFTGSRHDIPELLQAADIFVLPSLWEGLPMAVLEAMAAGLPVVATDVGGTAEAVVDQQTGVLVPPNDRVALRSALNGLLVNSESAQRRRQMGEAGYRRAKAAFSAEALTGQLQDLYQKLLA